MRLDQFARVREMAAAGHGRVVIARELGLKESAVGTAIRNLRRFGDLPPRREIANIPRRDCRGSSERLARVQALAESGRTAKEIAAEVGLTVGTVYNQLFRLRRLGRLPAFTTPVTPEKVGRVKALYASGLGRSLIARETGLAFGTVGHVLERLARAGEITRRPAHRPRLDFQQKGIPA